MKTYLTLVMGVISLNCLAQTTTDIKIDFGGKIITQLPDKNDLKKTNYTRVVVDNLPSGAYKIAINKTDSIVSVGTTPTLFGALTFGAGFNSLLAGLAGYSVRNVGALVARQQGPNTFTLMGGGLENLIGSMSLTEGSFLEYLAHLDCPTDNSDPILSSINDMRKNIFNFHFDFRDEVLKKADKELFEVDIKSQKDPNNFRRNAEAIIQKRPDLEKKLETDFFITIVKS